MPGLLQDRWLCAHCQSAPALTRHILQVGCQPETAAAHSGSQHSADRAAGVQQRRQRGHRCTHGPEADLGGSTHGACAHSAGPQSLAAAPGCQPCAGTGRRAAGNASGGVTASTSPLCSCPINPGGLGAHGAVAWMSSLLRHCWLTGARLLACLPVSAHFDVRPACVRARCWLLRQRLCSESITAQPLHAIAS